jgi:hypothetical protein
MGSYHRFCNIKNPKFDTGQVPEAKIYMILPLIPRNSSAANFSSVTHTEAVTVRSFSEPKLSLKLIYATRPIRTVLSSCHKKNTL